MFIHFIASKFRTFWERYIDPLPGLHRKAEALKAEIVKAKKQKKRYSHLEAELRHVMATIIAVERGISYRNGSLDWGR